MKTNDNDDETKATNVENFLNTFQHFTKTHMVFKGYDEFKDI